MSNKSVSKKLKVSAARPKKVGGDRAYPLGGYTAYYLEEDGFTGDTFLCGELWN